MKIEIENSRDTKDRKQENPRMWRKRQLRRTVHRKIAGTDTIKGETHKEAAITKNRYLERIKTMGRMNENGKLSRRSTECSLPKYQHRYEDE